MKKNLVGSLLVFGLIGTLFTGCGNSTESSAVATESSETEKSASTESEDDGLNEAAKISVGYQLNDITYLYEQKYHFVEEEFADDDIEIEWNFFESGPPEIEAFVSGDLDYCTSIGDTPYITALANDVEITCIGNIYEYPGNYQIVLAPGKEEEIKTLSDLAGHSIYIQAGANTQQYALLETESVGLTEDDVEFVNIGNISDARNALLTGEIDSGVFFGVSVGILQAEGCQVLDVGTPLKESVPMFLGRNEFIEQNPDITVRWLKAILKGYQYAVDNIEETKELLAESSGTDASNLGYVESLIVKTEFDADTIDQWQKTIDFLISNGTLDKELDANTIYNAEYLEQAVQLLEE